MSDDNETKIVDVDGDELLVTWDMTDDAVVMFEPLKDHCAILNMDGVNALRTALDKAEDAYYKRLASAPDAIVPQRIAEFEAVVTLDVSGAGSHDILKALVDHYGSREAVPVRACADALRTERITVPVVLYANGAKAIRAKK